MNEIEALRKELREEMNRKLDGVNKTVQEILAMLTGEPRKRTVEQYDDGIVMCYTPGSSDGSAAISILDLLKHHGEHGDQLAATAANEIERLLSAIRKHQTVSCDVIGKSKGYHVQELVDAGIDLWREAFPEEIDP